MIAGLIGTLHAVTPESVLVNVNGVIYRVQTSARTGSDGAVGAPIELHTHLVVREDSQQLFGFRTQRELTLFETLIGVNGVGPRLACAVLSRFTPDALLDAIAAEDVNLLSTVPGIGKRTASRILLDLRGKLPDDLGATRPATQSADPEALEALRALGYSSSEAVAALSSLPDGTGESSEDRVLAALRLLGTPSALA